MIAAMKNVLSLFQKYTMITSTFNFTHEIPEFCCYYHCDTFKKCGPKLNSNDLDLDTIPIKGLLRSGMKSSALSNSSLKSFDTEGSLSKECSFFFLAAVPRLSKKAFSFLIKQFL